MGNTLIVPDNVRRQCPPRVEPTAEHKHKWEETRAALLYKAPMFTHIFYTLMSDGGEHAYFIGDETTHTAMTDGEFIFINPEGFFKRPLGDRVFILAHEISHAMFDHPRQLQIVSKAGVIKYQDGTTMPFDNGTWQKAADIYINRLLKDGDIGTVPSDALMDGRFDTSMSVIDIYKAIFDPNKTGGSGGGFDIIVPPGTGKGQSPAQAMMERDDDKWQTEIQAAMSAAKARGNLPGSFETALGALLEPQVEWQKHIKALLNRKIGTGSYDWTRPDRRMISRKIDPIFSPGKRGKGCRLIVVIGDSSGSITDKTADHFFGEMSGIIDELDPEKLVFAWADTRPHGWTELEDADDLSRLHKQPMKGRGGTSFRKALQDVEQMDTVPDAVVYLTDGDGDFPSVEPPFPVIWGDISGSPRKYPFGEVVHVPVQV